MRNTSWILGVTLAACVVFSGGIALADKQEYSSMTPEQVENALRAERQAYKSVMKKIRELENSPVDKNSPEYKAKLEMLLNEAVERKVAIGAIGDALDDQEHAYGNK